MQKLILHKRNLNSKSYSKKKLSELSTTCKLIATPSICFKILRLFPSYIQVVSAIKSEIEYIEKLRVFEKNKFNSSWEIYETQLKQEMKKEIARKWVKVSQQEWINQENNKVNASEYIEKQVEKLFKKHYESYKQNDNKLANSKIQLELCLKEKNQIYIEQASLISFS